MIRQMTWRSLANHTGPIIFGKGIQYLGSILFAIMIPRLMGPEIYGPFAVYISALIIFGTLGDLGTLAIYGHYVPTFVANGDEKAVSKLFSHLVMIKFVAGVLIGILFVPLGRVILPGWPIALLWVGAVTLTLRITADNFYHLAFGLDNTARWIARESLRSVVQLSVIFILYVRYSLTGAILGILLTDLMFLILGLTWTKHYWSWQPRQARTLTPLLRYGFVFFIASACMMGFLRGGTVILSLFHIAPSEIAQYDLAFNVFLILFATMTQIVLAWGPTLTRWLASGRENDVKSALNLLWKISLLLAFIIVIVTLLTADLIVPIIFGPSYAPTSSLLKMIVLGLLPLALGQTSFLVGTVYKRIDVRLWASVTTLVVFVVLSLILTPSYGSFGPAFASVAAMVSYALTTYFLSRPLLRLNGWRADFDFFRSIMHHPND